MKYYNIFWIDDKHEEMSLFVQEAYENGLILHPKLSLEGLAELKNNQDKYDAVLLDVKFNRTNESNETPSNENSMFAYQKILTFDKKFEIYFFSGEEDTFTQDEGFRKFIPNANEVIFPKGEGNKKLIEVLINSSNRQKDRQIKSEYHEGFDVCTKSYIGKKAGDLLLKILTNEKDYNLNYVRQILEALFKKYKKLELIPGDLKFAQNSRFLSGSIENNLQLNESSRLPFPIAVTLRAVVRTVVAGSHYTHDDKELKKDVDKYLTNKYSKKAIVLLLIDVLINFKRQVDANPIKNNWVEIEFFEGEIKSLNFDRGNGWLKRGKLPDLFFYLNESENSEILNVGDRVKFSIGKNDIGPKAEKLVKIDTI
jgi:cold shock CspA family protein